jgi:hypothetical protein
MGTKKLTAAEKRAYRKLARAARELEDAQREAELERSKQHRRNRTEVAK